MTQLALARKWRPRTFEALVGQEHVVRALTHALGTGRLHHAYLFTGTRGVGKTTVARILAKALNCETGVTATPCGKCAACTGIDAGRFVDCIELDAASNRGVEEMTQLLENAVYAPTAGRYKVYVIDEVHMLSNHAFNAMLKTLEEPPEHVVFVLATTDPGKVPVTVLSRCLQFSLKNLPAQLIAGHLAHILQAEAVQAEPQALALIGRSAAGSMRDALSLLDQAIAYGAGELKLPEVREMLGTVDRDWLERIADALADGDGATLVAQADAMLAANQSFESALSELALMMQRIAVVQAGVPVDEDDSGLLQRLSSRFDREEVQLHYQIAIHAARDLPLAPDPHAGFTMALLRMLAFRPEPAGSASSPPDSPAAASVRSRSAPVVAPAQPRSAAVAASAQPRSASVTPSTPSRSAPTRPSAPPDPVAVEAVEQPSSVDVDPQRAVSVEQQALATPAQRPATSASQSEVSSATFDGNWPALVASLRATGLAAQLLEQSELLGCDGLKFNVRVPVKALAEQGTVRRARDLLVARFGPEARLAVEVGAVGDATAAAATRRQRDADEADAQASIEADPFVRSMMRDFDATIVPGSIRAQPRARDQSANGEQDA